MSNNRAYHNNGGYMEIETALEMAEALFDENEMGITSLGEYEGEVVAGLLNKIADMSVDNIRLRREIDEATADIP